MTVLAVEGISRQFGGLTALDSVSLAVSKGEIFGVMGANGAGKTTLFAVIAGHVKPTAGRVTLRGEDVTGLRPDLICRMGLTRTFQIVKPFGGLSVFDNAMTGALYGSRASRTRRDAEAVALQAIGDAGLSDRVDQEARMLTLSGQKRLEVARALATGARVILLDEVMAGLTPTEVEEMLAMVARLRAERGITFLVIEHVMKALMTLSDRVLVLHHGQEIALGTPEEIAADPQVLELYYGGAA